MTVIRSAYSKVSPAATAVNNNRPVGQATSAMPAIPPFVQPVLAEMPASITDVVERELSGAEVRPAFQELAAEAIPLKPQDGQMALREAATMKRLRLGPFSVERGLDGKSLTIIITANTGPEEYAGADDKVNSALITLPGPSGERLLVVVAREAPRANEQGSDTDTADADTTVKPGESESAS